jgi:hypothetical protein
MLRYYKVESDKSNPNFSFVSKLKELWKIIDEAPMEKFIDKEKIYDLYPLRNVLDDTDHGNNRFNMEEMADAGEAFGELLDLIYKDLVMLHKESMLVDAVRIPLEKHFTCICGKNQYFPYDDS